MKTPKATATSRSKPGGGGHDGRRYTGQSGTYTTRSRAGINLPNEDIGQTITLEEYRREGR